MLGLLVEVVSVRFSECFISVITTDFEEIWC